MKYKWQGKRVKKLTFKRKLTRVKDCLPKGVIPREVTEFLVKNVKVEIPCPNE